VLKSVRYAPFLQQSVQQQIVLSIRSLFSLPTTVCIIMSNIVHQVAVLPSFTVNLHCCKSGYSAPFLQQWGHSQLALLTVCSNFIPIYPNLFEFILNLSEFYRVFEWKEGSCDKVAWSVLSQQPSSHIGLTYILDTSDTISFQFWVSGGRLSIQLCDTGY